MGIQDEDAGELAIEGECTVFNKMWMSRRSRDQQLSTLYGLSEPAGCIECLLGLINVTTLPCAKSMIYRMSLKGDIGI